MTEPKVYKAKLSDFKPDPNNANKHKPRGRGVVERSQRQRGFARPGFSANDNTVLAGNLSFIEVSAEVFGVDSEVLVVETDGRTPIIHKRTDLAPDSEEARLLAYEDNRSAELSLDWDVDTLALDLASGLDLDGLFSDVDLQVMGINEFEYKNADGKEYDESVADGIHVCTCPTCGHQHAAKKD